MTDRHTLIFRHMQSLEPMSREVGIENLPGLLRSLALAVEKIVLMPIEQPIVLNDQEIAEIRGNRKISAIKLYRERTNSDLKTAKEAVDKFCELNVFNTSYQGER